MCIRFPYLFVEFGVDLVIIRVRVVLHDIHSTGGNIEFGPKQFVLESVGGVFANIKSFWSYKRKICGAKVQKVKIFWGQNENIKNLRIQV